MLERGEGRREPGEADDRVEHDVGLGQRGELGEHLGGIGAKRRAIESGTPNSSAWAASRSPLRPAASATTRYSSGWSRMTSSAWVPIDPVDPRRTTRRISTRPRATTR